jgi:hypothetical protein
VGHTLYDSAALIEQNGGKPPLTYKAFEKLMKVLLPCTCTAPLSCLLAKPASAGGWRARHLTAAVHAQDVGAPAAPLIDAPHQLPPVHAAAGMADTGVPTTAELGYDGAATTTLKAC